MNWLLFTILSLVGVSISNVLLRVVMKGDKSNPYSYAIVFSLLLTLVNLFFAVITKTQFNFTLINFTTMLIVSALWAIGQIFTFKALKVLEASEVTILSNFRIIVTIVASMILLHEGFGNQKIIGAAVIVFSVVLVTNMKKAFQFNNGVWYVLASAFFSGLAFVGDSYNVAHMSVLAYNTVGNFLIGVLTFLFYPKAVKQWRHFVEWDFLKKMLPLGFFSGLQGIAYLFALTTVGVTGQVGTIRQASVILTVILAILFLNERDHLIRKIIAAMLVTGGVLLLS